MDIDREAAELADQERLLNQSWIWHLPRTRWESAIVGAAVSWLIPALWATVAFGSWPWWQRVGVAIVIAPWMLIAAAMATRAPWCRGVGPAAIVIAAAPATAWAAVVIAAHTIAMPDWVHRLAVPVVYISLSVATVMVWRRWTDATAEARRAARWDAEGDDGPPLGL